MRFTRSLPLIAVILLAACGGGGSDATPTTLTTPTTPTPAAVATVAVTPTTGTMLVGGTSTLTVTMSDASGNALTGRTVTWATSAATVATVSAGGVVTAVGAGTVTITVTSEGKTAQATFTVTPVVLPVATVLVTPDSTDVAYAATRTLTVVTRDAAGAPLTGRPVTWTTSDATIATVSAAGVVTALVPGTVTITATSEGKTGAARLRVTPADLTAIVDSIRRALNVPGLSAAIVTRTGGVMAIGAAGVRRWGSTTPVTVADKWHIGSDTKAMTGFLTAMAVKQGLLSWNDALTTRYPELATGIRPEFAGLTLRDLANMKSGIVGNPGFTPTGTLAQQRLAVDQWAVKQAPAAAVGTYYYSNINYQLLAEVAGRAFGGGYEQALRDRIWTPLGITTGGFGPTTTAGATDQPIGHSPAGTGWAPCEACDNSWANGSGKVHMSLGDWSKFIREVMRADAGESVLLSQADARVLTSATTPIGGAQSYGVGWITFTNTTQRIVTHDGSNTYNRSRAQLYLDPGLAFLVNTNAGDGVTADGGVPAAALTAVVTRLQAFWQTKQ